MGDVFMQSISPFDLGRLRPGIRFTGPLVEIPEELFATEKKKKRRNKMAVLNGKGKTPAELLNEAQKSLHSLQSRLAQMDVEIGRHEIGQEFPIEWCTVMMQEAETIYSEIVRYNGEISGRVITPEKEPAVHLND